MIFNIAILLLITTTFKCVNQLHMYYEMNESNNTRFDYAFTEVSHRVTVNHYIIRDGYDYQIYKYTDMSLHIYPSTGLLAREKIVESGLAISINYRDEKHNLMCFYKVNIKKFVCHVNRRLADDITVQYDLFECSSQPIDMKRVIAFHPQSYSNNDIHEVLLIERVANKKTIQRSVWISYWPTLKNPYCIKKTEPYFPEFLKSIDNSLEITGILSITHNNTASAIVLFYHNSEHKFCVTYEYALNPSCNITNLRPYLPPYIKHRNETIDAKTTVNPNKPSKLILIIIGSIFLTCVICMILMLCFICYAKYKNKKSKEKRKSKPKYYKYKKTDSNSTKTESLELSESESTAKTTGFEISDEDVNTFNKSTSDSDESIELKRPKELNILKKK